MIINFFIMHPPFLITHFLVFESFFMDQKDTCVISIQEGCQMEFCKLERNGVKYSKIEIKHLLKRI